MLVYLALFQYWSKCCTFNFVVTSMSQLPYNVQGIYTHTFGWRSMDYNLNNYLISRLSILPNDTYAMATAAAQTCGLVIRTESCTVALDHTHKVEKFLWQCPPWNESVSGVRCCPDMTCINKLYAYVHKFERTEAILPRKANRSKVNTWLKLFSYEHICILKTIWMFTHIKPNTPHSWHMGILYSQDVARN